MQTTPETFLPQRVRQATERAIASGAMLPLQLESVAVAEGDMHYLVNHLSSLSLKDMATAMQRSQGGNPFLPYEDDLFVADLSETHVLLLNKFPLQEGHVIAITRRFVPQMAALDTADFHALAQLLAQMGGVVMYNGGSVGGASQPHKHLHLMPGTVLPLADQFPLDAPVGSVQEIPAFRFRHAFVRLAPATGDLADSVASLQSLFQVACEYCGLRVGDDGLLPPYNLLGTRDWLLVVPRSAPAWSRDDVSIPVAALNYGGLITVRGAEHIDVVREVGVLPILEAVSVLP